MSAYTPDQAVYKPGLRYLLHFALRPETTYTQLAADLLHKRIPRDEFARDVRRRLRPGARLRQADRERADYKRWLRDLEHSSSAVYCVVGNETGDIYMIFRALSGATEHVNSLTDSHRYRVLPWKVLP